ncbi:MAG: YerC/YecD family TrpR-related protein [bacterium]
MRMRDFRFNKKTREMFNAILKLKDIKEAENFFRDLCTAEELRAMSERFAVASMLEEGFSYRDVADTLHVSVTTVSRVAFWLKNGKGGYKLALNRLNHHKSNSLEKGLR